MKKQIQKICGLAAALWAAFSLSSLGAVAYYQKTLPDQFYVSSADAVSFSGATPFFTGVFGAELVKGKSIQAAAIKAHRAAMLCMEKVGVYAAFPTVEQLEGI